MSRTPTAEQAKCIQSLVDGAPVTRVSACAGSGKTSTLCMMAEAVQKRSLYLAFNKVTATEAAEKFPPHVQCSTTHSRAYSAFGVKLRNKLQRPAGGYVNVAGTASEVARYYKIKPIGTMNGTTLGAGFLGLLVKETVANFEQSSDIEIAPHHVPKAQLREKSKGEAYSFFSSVCNTVVLLAKQLWADRVDPGTIVLATHDTYLKLYQLSKPVFSGVEVLYVDEFQDTTPCVLDIVQNQIGHMQIVVVGDARQAIYGWRGAINAMSSIDGADHKLTKSFRYGPAVADVATAVLERDMVIEGHEPIKSVVGASQVVDRTQPFTRIFRTNAALLEAAVWELLSGRSISIEVDVKDFVKLLQSAKALYEGDMAQVKHEDLLAFSNWAELVEESAADPTLGRIVKMVKSGNDLNRWVEILSRYVKPKVFHVTFTTAHKSKGREWSQVVLEDDFKSPSSTESVEEQNLLYVACTRAIDRLEYNRSVEEYLFRGKAEAGVSTAAEPETIEP